MIFRAEFLFFWPVWGGAGGHGSMGAHPIGRFLLALRDSHQSITDCSN
jgi:hypothetical protein